MDIVTIRASSLPELFDCAARWESKYINGNRMPSSSNAILGSAVHAGTALFDEHIMLEKPISIDDATGVVVDTINKPDEDVEWGDDSKKSAENIAIALHTLYCRDISPKQKYFAVEAKCERLEIKDIGIALTGRLDRIHMVEVGYFDGEIDYNLGLTDIKTGIQAVSADGKVKTQGHTAQVAVYELLAEQSLNIEILAPAQIIGLQVAKTAKGQRAGIGNISGGRELLLGDDENKGLLVHASNIVHSGLFVGNPKSMMCHAKYCPIYNICRFRR